MPHAIDVRQLVHHYGRHKALAGVEFTVAPGEIFGLLGPNGGGKTTLFRLLSTLLPVQQGEVEVLQLNVVRQQAAVRNRIGVTFQSPSLDAKLTVQENLRHQGHLYGLSGKRLKSRIAVLLDRLGLTDRNRDRVESLSGGLKRRVEIAKGLLHDPELLLLDEPSTGLDPGARHDLWKYLKQLQSEANVTVLVTTHLMEEAEHCDRLGILDRGQLVALGTPAELRAEVGGDCLTIHSDQAEDLCDRIRDELGVDSKLLGETVRIESNRGHQLLGQLVERFPESITSISLGKPTLEDVFIAKTGHQFWDAENEAVRH